MWGGYYDACGGDIMMHVGIPRVHQGMFSTLGGYHEYSRGYIIYIYIMSTSGDIQYIRGIS